MFKQRICSFLVVVALMFQAQVSHAASDTLTASGKRGKIIAKSAVYGLGGGLVIGLASQVFKKETKNIFLFGSLGLYAGIALGIYVISTSKSPQPYEGPDTYEDYGYSSGIDFRHVPEKQSTLLSSESFVQDEKAFSMNLLSMSF